MKGFLIKDNKLEKVLIIKKEELKEVFMELKSSYKYKEKFIEENYNVSFGILVIENFLVIVEYVLKNYNVNVGVKTSLKYDVEKEEYILRFEINRFYDFDLSDKNETEINDYMNAVDSLEMDVLNDYLDKIPDTDNIREKIFTFCNNTNNIDESIKTYKANNKEVKKKELNFVILKGLFDVFALNVLKDTVIKDYIEEKDGR